MASFILFMILSFLSMYSRHLSLSSVDRFSPIMSVLMREWQKE